MEDIRGSELRPKKLTFQKAFRVMRGKGNAIPLPKWEPVEIEDFYTLYVIIMGVPEDTFWYSDIGLVKTVAANKQALDKWINRQQEARHGGKRKK